MTFDKALQYAVVLGWDDLKTPDEPQSVRVEYIPNPRARLENLNVWAVDEAGHQFLVCEYWSWTSADHKSGVRFAGKYHSENLAQALTFIMKHQDEFTRPSAQSTGLVTVEPPSPADRTEAAEWAKTIHVAVPAHA